jgi:putative membrane protein
MSVIAATSTPQSLFGVRLLATDTPRRLYALAVLVAAPAGLISGLVKLGWEVPFPPRTAQHVTNPP